MCGGIVRLLLIIIMLLMCILSGYFLNSVYELREFARAVMVEPRSAQPSENGSIKVGIIGDSWVLGTKLKEYFEAELREFGIIAEVINEGHGGASSKQIYLDLFIPETERFSSRNILFSEDVDYCIIIAGVNDSAGYLGADFYAYHMGRIASALCARGIVPVILELPEFGIEETKSFSTGHGIKLLLLRYLFNGGEKNVIGAYRAALLDSLGQYELTDKTIVVDYDSFIDDYSNHKNLYSDILHLNDEGRKGLAKLLAESIKDAHL